MTEAEPIVDNDSEPQPPRRGRRASTDVAAVMIIAAVLAILMVGAYNYYAGRSFINTFVEGQLRDSGTGRAGRIERGLQEARDVVSILAGEPVMTDALEDLGTAYAAMGESLTPDEMAALRTRYERGILLATPPGVEPPTVDELFPVTTQAQYLQYWYLLQNPHEDRADLVDPGDGSGYSAAHAVQHPIIRSLTSHLVLGDLLLIDAATKSIVYSLDKNADFGTDLGGGPYRDTGLAEAVLGKLIGGSTQEAVLVDFESYAPSGGEPVMWIAAPIHRDGALIGAIAAAIPNERLGAITTADEDWEGTGLGETGEVYIVGADHLMRSDSRLWLQDPDEYLRAVEKAGYPAEIGEAVNAFGTTVLIQPVETEAVRTALAGDEFAESTKNYLDQKTLTVATPLNVQELHWVAVTEAQASELNGPLNSYLWRLLLVALVIIPLVVVLSYAIAKRLLRPIAPIAAAADEVATGNLDVVLDARGRDEFSELAGQFNDFVAALAEQQAAGIRTEAETTELLASVVPQRMVDRVREGDRDIAESLANATLIAISVGTSGGASHSEDLVDHSVELSIGLAALSRDHGAEQLSSSTTGYLFATGLESPELRIEDAVAFAVAARSWIAELGEATGLINTCAIGVATGEVVAGIVGTERMAVDVLGTPRRTALGLSAAAEAGQILVDSAIAARIDSAWRIERVQNLADIEGTPLEGWQVLGDRRTGA